MQIDTSKTVTCAEVWTPMISIIVGDDLDILILGVHIPHEIWISY